MSNIVQVDMIVQQIMNLFPESNQNNKIKESPKENDIQNKKVSINGFLSETKGETKQLKNSFSLEDETSPLTSEPVKEETINKLKKKEEPKNTLEHISIVEDAEDDVNSISHTKRKGKDQVKKEKEKVEKLCGKKRKGCHKIKISKEKENDLASSQSIALHKDIPQLSETPQPPEIEDKESKILIEKDLLGNLVKKEGFMKVFNCLTITPLNRKDPLQRQIDDIINSIGLLRTSLILSQIKFETIENKNNNQINNNTDTNTNQKANEIIPEPENESQSNNINNNNNMNSISSRTRSSKSHEIINIISENSDKKRKLPKRKKLKAFSLNRINKREKEKISSKNEELVPCSAKNVSFDEFKNERLELGVHFQKDNEGNIYKYLKHHFRENKGNKMYIYYCADTRCKSKACYYITGMKFVLIKEHGLKHEDHCYMQKRDRTDKYRVIIDEFKARNCTEAQVFKRSDGTTIVKWYDSPL